MNTQFGLVADIGGTNARFALVPLDTLNRPLSLSDVLQVKTLNVAEFTTPELAINHYLAGLPDSLTRPRHAVLAIACPTDKDRIEMTNTHWSFSVSQLRAQLGFERLDCINDFYAVANAVPCLTDQDLVSVGQGTPEPGYPIVVTGAGTGLGLGALVFDDQGKTITVQGEGGHIHFAPLDDTESFVFDYLRRKHPRVSVERLVSGQGIENIYEALYFKHHGQPIRRSAGDISRDALEHQDPLSVETLEVFCHVFGSFAGDAALMFGARGGVYLGGGILPRMIPFLQQSRFRTRFTDKARMAGFVSAIPTYVITCSQPGLLGAGVVLRQRCGAS